MFGELIIRENGTLSIDDAGDDGIAALGLLTNEGTITIRNCDEGISARDTLTNDGTILIMECRDGIRMGGTSPLVTNRSNIEIYGAERHGVLGNVGYLQNEGTLTIESAMWGLVFTTSTTANFSTASKITINNTTAEGLGSRHNAVITNAGDIIIDEFGAEGINLYGSIINSGKIVLTQDVTNGIGVRIDSFACCSTAYLGSLTNTPTGVIQIDHAATGLIMETSTTLMDQGEIAITNSVAGFQIEPRGSATMTSGAEMTIESTSQPIRVKLEATFDVQAGAELTAND